MLAPVLFDGNPLLATHDPQLLGDSDKRVAVQRLADLCQRADVVDRCVEEPLRRRASPRRSVCSAVSTAELAGAVQLDIRTGAPAATTGRSRRPTQVAPERVVMWQFVSGTDPGDYTRGR